MTLFSMEYFFGWFRSSASLCPLPISCAPQSSHSEAGWETGSLDAQQTLFSWDTGTSVCSQHCFGHPLNHSTVQAALKKRSFIPTRHSTYCYPCFSCHMPYITFWCSRDRILLGARWPVSLMKHFYHLFMQWVKLTNEKSVASITLVSDEWFVRAFGGIYGKKWTRLLTHSILPYVEIIQYIYSYFIEK